MADITNTFMGGRMEKDLDERLLPEGLYRDALNIDIDISEGANVGSARNKLGNTKIADLATISGQAIQNCRTIGATKYERDNLIYWLVASDKFDGIYEYNEITGQTVRVLQSNKATPSTASKLNFSQQYIVTGINYINGFLYWTDNYNPPRKINIARAKSYSIDDVKIDDDINVILAPPLRSPSISLFDDGTQSNNMEEKFIYFSYRYKYIDDQYSAMSPFSAVSFTPDEFNLDYMNGNNAALINLKNSATITFETGGLNVKEIQLLMRDTRNSNISVIESFNKKKLGLKDNYTHSFKFKNNKTYTILNTDQSTRLFDNVPLLAKAQDFVGNRLMYGNYTQFYNITDCDGKDIKIDLNLKSEYASTTKNVPIQTFRSDRDYEVGIVYLDDYGRTTTVLTSENNTHYIPAYQSIYGNSLVATIKHLPPCWATKYRLVLKQNKNSYYNIFPLQLYVSGLDRYFLINTNDRDKVKVGGYIIIKSSAAGASLSNKKYKVIDLVLKDAGFISGAPSGLYVKIKVDSISDITNTGSYTYNSASNGTNVKPGSTDVIYGARSQVAENPIFYGNGNPNAFRLNNNAYNPGINRDLRFTFEVTSSTTFRYTLDVSGSGSWVENQVISSSPTPIYVSIGGIFSIQVAAIYIKWDTSQGITVGDKWKVNCRSSASFGNNVFGGRLPYRGSSDDYVQGVKGGYAILPAKNWSDSSPEVDRKIRRGALIKIKIEEDTTNAQQHYDEQTWTSPQTYDNIEEWFIESGAYASFRNLNAGDNVGASSVTFRRGKNYTDSSIQKNGDTYDYSTIEQQGSSPENLNYPVRMIIQGQGGGKWNQFKVSFSITQTDNSWICETAPEENDLDVYHELSKTYSIVGNKHKVLWKYSDFTTPSYSGGKTNLGQLTPGSIPTASDIPHSFNVGERVYVRSNNNNYMPSGYYTILQVPDCYNIVIDFPFPGAGPVTGGGISYSTTDQDQTSTGGVDAIIKINNPGTQNSDFNGWSFGNGLESDRIYDDWNAPTLEYSIRVNSTVEEYKQRVSDNAICYSGIYGQNTGVNKLNEFNLSIANFKYLDKDFGSIQKLHSRDTDLLVFQYDKISKVLYGKNLLSDAVGGGQVVSIPEVLGTQIAFPYENGISINPESFGYNGEDIYITDARRGTVLNVAGDGLVEINIGMNDYFRDLMRQNPNTQKLGAYDPHNQMYVLATNDKTVKPCKLTLSRYSGTFSNLGTTTSTKPTFLFAIESDADWTITKVSTGSGTNWLSLSNTTGYGNQDIFGAIAINSSGVNRSMQIVVTYCGGALSQTYTLTQGKYKDLGVIVMVNETSKQIR